MWENSDKMGWCGAFLDMRAGPAKLQIYFTWPYYSQVLFCRKNKNEIVSDLSITYIYMFVIFCLKLVPSPKPELKSQGDTNIEKMLKVWALDSLKRSYINFKQ